MAEMRDGFWVFGYGSLMWRPGFEHAERCVAELDGHRRSFCLESHRYRGTPEAPGLVLALEPMTGASCRGIAYRVDGGGAKVALDYLRERELVTRSYHERVLPLRLDDGRAVEGIAYVIDQTHRQYACGLSVEEKAEIIARSVGPAGPNSEYLFNTLADLRRMGVHDEEIERLALLVGRQEGAVSP